MQGFLASAQPTALKVKKPNVTNNNHLSIAMKRSPKTPCYPLNITGLIGLLTLLSACSQVPRTAHWHEQYSYLQHTRPQNKTITETDYYLVFLVAAHHLDYRDNKNLAHSLISYSDGKGGLGHSWVYLKGLKAGEPEVLEGGQSGQLGKMQPVHFAGIKNYIKFGYADPTAAQKSKPRHEANPIKYLWAEFQDGFFSKEAEDTNQPMLPKLI